MLFRMEILPAHQRDTLADEGARSLQAPWHRQFSHTVLLKSPARKTLAAKLHGIQWFCNFCRAQLGNSRDRGHTVGLSCYTRDCDYELLRGVEPDSPQVAFVGSSATLIDSNHVPPPAENFIT